MKSDRLEIVFARNDGYLWGKNVPAVDLTLHSRQIQKWKSRQTARFLLTQLFEKYQLDLNLLNNIQKTATGRPFVADERIDFNISHSGDWVAVIFSYSEGKKAVGIDIEHPQKTRRYKALLDYYASETEKTYLLKDPAKLVEHFYLSWCLREAILKSQGVGMVKLREVCHSPIQKAIACEYCPTGTLHFFSQFPFYLCYFFEGSAVPEISQYHQGNLQKIEKILPLVYQVN
ncbi:4'-phosphopantetheinyl transferase sfp [Phocoenobacter uteri]|uniref:4'-phosphopantetheinyl transferase sfp n=1 Tax=Phocoenobacter uteri TaxID=146806 RepID=A0A379CCJ1_9PAST|nr:4'-phosphopantetheinyl transferase superfamily protein [Phocoenobacter uteri]MDG6881886.1 4'-phosphopantetheinyl transferase [Phocoenobacter uteri]SUB59924.1 4'-phosphopantetheinyl transferase sfp [Phocoenobacter uteri]